MAWYGSVHRFGLGRLAAYNGAVAILSAQEVLEMREMKEFAGLYYREGALDPKTMQLVALAAMAAAGCTS